MPMNVNTSNVNTPNSGHSFLNASKGLEKTFRFAIAPAEIAVGASLLTMGGSSVMGATTMGMSLRSSQDSLINRDYQLGNNKRHSLIKPLGMAYDCTRGVAALGAPGVAVGAVVVAIGVEDVRGISSCGHE